MKLAKLLITIVSGVMLSMSVHAEDANSKIEANLAKIGLEVESIKASKMDNVYEVFTNQGLFYSSADGSFLIQGKLYQIQEAGIASLTEEALAEQRVAGMERFSESMIVFPATEEKYQMTVFTDLTCGYCRKLHNQMQAYNDMGITVRYLAFPRGGLNSKSYTDIRSVWCSDDQQSAMTRAKGGSQIDQKICKQPVGEQYEFGKKIGVSGTPAIMLDDGLMVPGYKTPEQMKQILEAYSAQKG
ncbi:bifunctional protein-disulfide isomerase/oxidoreductase DsbC [Thalassotalea sp. HSM 43]|uniref:bifunctional protein-disulfide isomerase/oxidoreductase DsbC n=1 Tax=Thalassotalea sp. HSM 43 TaxID=2552945 RepID=UPI001081E155|nr:bifunctional protein-disulfide isomerase/oxidoreductase DsbC [Thalassotalea sp. HSM 43]QBY03598.1 bifunctional protein-disulfide isomerase/oxidoreductase DsbC [Thalassotalea sp. HSM 43]